MHLVPDHDCLVQYFVLDPALSLQFLVFVRNDVPHTPAAFDDQTADLDEGVGVVFFFGKQVPDLHLAVDGRRHQHLRAHELVAFEVDDRRMVCSEQPDLYKIPLLNNKIIMTTLYLSLKDTIIMECCKMIIIRRMLLYQIANRLYRHTSIGIAYD